MHNRSVHRAGSTVAWLVVICASVAGTIAYFVSYELFASSEKHGRGLDFVPDMYTSPADKSQQAREVVLGTDGTVIAVPVTFDAVGQIPKDGQIRDVPSLMVSPAGTVSRDFVPYQYEAMDFLGPHGLQNPLAATADVLRTGQKYFNIYCVVCHGNDGNAVNGYVSHKFSGIPSLNGPNLALLTDGDLYHIVTSGRNKMPNYKAQLLPEQRWAVISYLRVLNRSVQALTDAEAILKSCEADVKAKPSDAAAVAAFDAAKAVAANAKHDLELIQRGGGDAFQPAPAPKPEYIKPSWSVEK